MKNIEWTFSEVWNKSLGEGAQRPLEPRDYLWASELYGAPVDVWLKMRATPYTNPPNERSLRKFEAAALTEWILKVILKRAGILIDEERRCEYQYDGLLKVTGRLDKLAGGTPDFEAARDHLMLLELPEGIQRGAKSIVEHLQGKYPEGLGEKPVEIKSVSSFAMDSMEKKNVSIKRHRVQLYHYLRSANYERGSLLYICRDDLRMAEFNIFLNSSVENEYKERIEMLTKQHTGEQPCNDPLLLWDEDFGKFSKNLNVEYSPYLTMLYGYETPREYSDAWGRKATSWNGVIKRIATGAKMTPKNKEYIEAMEKEGYNPEELAKQIPLDDAEEAEEV